MVERKLFRAFSRESRHWVLSMLDPLDPLDSVSSASYLINFCKLALKISHYTANPPLPSPPPSRLISLPRTRKAMAEASTVTF
jgi:hypothetical protein